MAKCQCITVRGVRCKLNAKEGSKYCTRHMKKCPPRKTKTAGRKSKPSAKVASPSKAKAFKYQPPKHTYKSQTVSVKYAGKGYRIQVHPYDTLDQIERALKKSFGIENKRTELTLSLDDHLLRGRLDRHMPIMCIKQAEKRLHGGLWLSII